MSYLNVEIKARCPDPEAVRNYLISHRAEFKGIDEQTDTYFKVPAGRLKLREGIIENNLIFYHRNNQAGPKKSHFQLVKITDPATFKSMMEACCGILMVVKKKREIYYIENVKFHIDEVPRLGWFVEIEAGNILADKSETELQEQCRYYMRELFIKPEHLMEESYSDLLLQLPATG